MCGLVGVYSSNMLSKHKNILTDLLFFDTLRGRDSTGVAAIRNNWSTHVLKSTVPGHDFIEDPRYDKHLSFADWCWIGHNRWKTVGTVSKQNAHPFMVLDETGACHLVGAHNGTLKNKHVLTNHTDYGTDSEALYNDIAFKGLEDTISKVEGAWALSYFDHINKELRFLRNKERPLFFAFEEGKKTLFWASEVWMIRIATSRHGIKLDEDKIFSFEEDVLYRFPAPPKLNSELTYEKKEGVVGKEPGFFQGYTYHQGWDRERWTSGVHATNARTQPETEKKTPETGKVLPLTQQDNSSTQSTTKSETVGEKQPSSSDTSSKKPLSGNNVRPILGSKSYKGFGGRLLSKAEILDQLNGGCSWCEANFISLEGRFGWLADNHPLCSDCLDDTHTNPNDLVKIPTVH